MVPGGEEGSRHFVEDDRLGLETFESVGRECRLEDSPTVCGVGILIEPASLFSNCQLGIP